MALETNSNFAFDPASPLAAFGKEFGQFVEQLGPVEAGCVVVVPQIQLCPYVSALLSQYFENSGDAFVLIYPERYAVCRQFFDFGDRTIHLDVSGLQKSADVSAEVLIRALQGKFQRLKFLLHPFAQGFNEGLGRQIFAAGQTENLLFYADGSRNNFLLEWDRDKSSNLIEMAALSGVPVALNCFGFDSSEEAAILGAEIRDVHVVDYRYVDATYANALVNARIDDNRAKDLLRTASNALVLGRYWGLEPYWFRSKQAMATCYSSSIRKATKSAKGYLVYRDDDRSKASRIATGVQGGDLPALDFSDVVSLSVGRHEDCLMEVFVSEVPRLLELFRVIYCFDSSFPLVFQSRKLRALLSDETEIVIGFDYGLVQRHSLESGVAVMVDRVVGVTQNIMQLELFRVFTRQGPLNGIDGRDRKSIERAFVESSGFFYLRNQ